MQKTGIRDGPYLMHTLHYKLNKALDRKAAEYHQYVNASFKR